MYTAVATGGRMLSHQGLSSVVRIPRLAPREHLWSCHGGRMAAEVAQRRALLSQEALQVLVLLLLLRVCCPLQLS